MAAPLTRRLANLVFGGAVCGLAVFLAGCSSSPSTPPVSGSPATSAATGSASAGSSAVSANPDAGLSGSASIPAGTPTTLIGTLAAGVENGCVVLVDDAGAVLANVIGVDSAAAPLGSKVEVSGQFEPDMMTICQQGDAFAVASVVVR